MRGELLRDCGSETISLCGASVGPQNAGHSFVHARVLCSLRKKLLHLSQVFRRERVVMTRKLILLVWIFSFFTRTASARCYKCSLGHGMKTALYRLWILYDFG